MRNPGGGWPLGQLTERPGESTPTSAESGCRKSFHRHHVSARFLSVDVHGECFGTPRDAFSALGAGRFVAAERVEAGENDVEARVDVARRQGPPPHDLLEHDRADDHTDELLSVQLCAELPAS